MTALNLAEIAELIASFPPPRHRELRCHPIVAAWLRITPPEAQPKSPWMELGSIGSLTGIPVIEKPDLGIGCWELYENGEMVNSGRLRPAEPTDFMSLPLLRG